MLETLCHKIKPHDDIELGFVREELDYYISIPYEGITESTGIILTIPGFGGLANTSYQLEKLNPYLAEKYNCVVVSINYFGIYRGVKTLTDSLFTENMKNIYGVPSDYWDNISSDNDFYTKVGQLLESKGLSQLDPRCQALRITERNEYQSFGFLPALDHLAVLGDVLRRYPLLDKKKIIAYGSSYGGYIAMLCGKFAPNTFSVIIDNSGFSRSEMKHIVGREIFEPDFAVNLNYNNKSYTLNYAYNNPWTILDETSPNYFGDSHKLIRNLLAREHRIPSETRYYLFHCEEDHIASVKDKDMVATLLTNYNFTYYKRIGEADLDGALFKNYTHAMNASLRKLFDYVAELDLKYGLTKELSENEFSKNTLHSMNCGRSSYIFEFRENFTMNVTIRDNIKTDYDLKHSFQLMRSMLDICDSIEEGFDFILNKISEQNYNEAATVMQDVLDAYTTINQQLDSLSNLLNENNLAPLNAQFNDHLLEAVMYFNQDSWGPLEDELSQQVVPCFLIWKTEIHSIFSPYLKN
ncbi:DUF2920 family protein [Paenibacillus borealis]|uniref:DUF8042 domain-containing protein n=1 Tax=Paenibacillus borealis TaxID=160799 RepID=A0A089MY01_PAEBO|nr:DUF2920 family protein [Paenibacillus borealis]AIQ61279.1 hypothetical protein PBOR_33555 [Paenibacillus borealis]